MELADAPNYSWGPKQSVYNWETGKATPRKELLGRIAAFRKMGKREALQRLQSLSGKRMSSNTGKARRKP